MIKKREKQSIPIEKTIHSDVIGFSGTSVQSDF